MHEVYVLNAYTLCTSAYAYLQLTHNQINITNATEMMWTILYHYIAVHTSYSYSILYK